MVQDGVAGRDAFAALATNVRASQLPLGLKEQRDREGVRPALDVHTGVCSYRLNQ